MWELYFLRPDAATALDDERVQRVLPRYVRVAEDELQANFQILKKIEFKPRKNSSNKQLWQIHEKLMKKFYYIKKKLDSSKKFIDNSECPRFSLLDLKIQLTKDMMENCELCERKCRVNRLKGELGNCRVGNECLISSEFTHVGEEPHIIPSHTIFFMGCNLHCQFCQNWSISQWYESGYNVSSKFLSEQIEKKRKAGCRNVNYVGGSPTPSLLWVLESLKYCNVNIPAIWNSNMYMTEKTMRILDGTMDMFLSDFKYGNDRCASRLSKVSKYFGVCSRNHLLAGKQGGITLRHLILPNHLECCTFPILDWIVKNIKERCLINLMDQFSPKWKASEYPEINRKITQEEFTKTVNHAKELGLNFIT